jgi:hypothetical protein
LRATQNGRAVLCGSGTFNLENLFTRPAAMNQDNDAIGRQAIEDHSTANRIVAKTTYSPDDKAKLLELTEKYSGIC